MVFLLKTLFISLLLAVLMNAIYYENGQTNSYDVEPTQKVTKRDIRRRHFYMKTGPNGKQPKSNKFEANLIFDAEAINLKPISKFNAEAIVGPIGIPCLTNTTCTATNIPNIACINNVCQCIQPWIWSFELEQCICPGEPNGCAPCTSSPDCSATLHTECLDNLCSCEAPWTWDYVNLFCSCPCPMYAIDGDGNCNCTVPQPAPCSCPEVPAETCSDYWIYDGADLICSKGTTRPGCPGSDPHCCDQVISLGFTFNYFGQNFTQIRTLSAGYVFFRSILETCLLTCCGTQMDTIEKAFAIAGYHSHMHTANDNQEISGGTIYYTQVPVEVNDLTQITTEIREYERLVNNVTSLICPTNVYSIRYDRVQIIQATPIFVTFEILLVTDNFYSYVIIRNSECPISSVSLWTPTGVIYVDGSNQRVNIDKGTPECNATNVDMAGTWVFSTALSIFG